jgi:hypothetical protein
MAYRTRARAFGYLDTRFTGVRWGLLALYA